MHTRSRQRDVFVVGVQANHALHAHSGDERQLALWAEALPRIVDPRGLTEWDAARRRLA